MNDACGCIDLVGSMNGFRIPIYVMVPRSGLVQKEVVEVHVLEIPLVVKSSNGRYILAGIVSWGVVVDESSYCGEPNRPGVYTRISKFKSWIKYVIAKFT